MNRKAFTLIELLVVIAIIAILAAILFPVFAQAKAAAKASAGLSNVKQQALAIIMYQSDNDDTNPLATFWNTGTDPLTFGTGYAFSTWAWVAQPYMKNGSLLMDPLIAGNAPIGSIPQIALDTYYTQFGYNYTWLSPDFGATQPGDQTATTSTAFEQHAATVMITSKWANIENKSGFVYATAFPAPGIPGGALADPVSESPSCYTIPMWCLAGWGGGAGSFYDDTLKLGEDAGKFTGGTSHRQANQTTVAWLDGHASRLAPGRLAQGTNWTSTAPEGVETTDETKYVWDNK